MCKSTVVCDEAVDDWRVISLQQTVINEARNSEWRKRL